MSAEDIYKAALEQIVKDGGVGALTQANFALGLGEKFSTQPIPVEDAKAYIVKAHDSLVEALEENRREWTSGVDDCITSAMGSLLEAMSCL